MKRMIGAAVAAFILGLTAASTSPAAAVPSSPAPPAVVSILSPGNGTVGPTVFSFDAYGLASGFFKCKSNQSEIAGAILHCYKVSSK